MISDNFKKEIDLFFKWLEVESYSIENINEEKIRIDEDFELEDFTEPSRNKIETYIKELLNSDSSLNFIEKNIEVYDVITADEAFVTGTPFCLLPVTSINSIKINNKHSESIYNKILSMWSERVDVDIKKQIQEWDK